MAKFLPQVPDGRRFMLATGLVPTVVLGNVVFLGVVVIQAVVQLVIVGMAIYLATYMQHALGLTSSMAGVAMLLYTLVFLPMNIVAGRVTDRFEAFAIALAGCGAVLAGLLWLGAVASAREYAILIPGLVAIAVGVPLAIISLLSAGLGTVKPAVRGEAAGIITAVRWLGSALATILLGVIVHSVVAGDLAADVAAGRLTQFDVDHAGALAPKGSGVAPDVVNRLREAFAVGYETAFFTMAGLALVASLIAGAFAVWQRRRRATVGHGAV